MLNSISKPPEDEDKDFDWKPWTMIICLLLLMLIKRNKNLLVMFLSLISYLVSTRRSTG